MYVLKSARMPSAEDAAPRGKEVPGGRLPNGALGELPIVIYLDTRAFTRDCVGGWLRSSLSGFSVCILQDPDQIETMPIASGEPQAVIINAGPERISSAPVTRRLTRLNERFPEVPIAVLSDHEDTESIREAFNLGVRGYIPTSLESRVAIGAVHLVCVGGTFAPAATLLSESDRRQASSGEPLIEGFTQRQSQILDCLRRGMANKLIAYELDMCESTVKVHIRNIMKKLNATNRTQVAYLTRGFFEGQHQLA
jgi:DNA-binding NarL/FixJ family response regulator